MPLTQRYLSGKSLKITCFFHTFSLSDIQKRDLHSSFDIHNMTQHHCSNLEKNWALSDNLVLLYGLLCDLTLCLKIHYKRCVHTRKVLPNLAVLRFTPNFSHSFVKCWEVSRPIFAAEKRFVVCVGPVLCSKMH